MSLNRWFMPVVILVMGVGLLGWNVGTVPLSGTEGHRAITAHQMAQSARWQDWAVPRLFGELYLRKPPLHYWALAMIERVTGQGNVWTWRLPSVLWFALTAVVAGLFAGRWFGKPADVVAGLGTLTLVALWSSARTADLDALNNFLAVMSALLVIELGFNVETRNSKLETRILGEGVESLRHGGFFRVAGRGFRVLLLTLALGAMLLTKGPAGLPVVAGAWLGASVCTGKWKWLARPSIWLPVIGAVAIAAAWVCMAWWALKSDGVTADWRGVEEAQHNVFNLARVFESLGMAGQIVLFGLPWSIVLGWWWTVRRQRATLDAVVGTFLGGLVICILNGVANPRYAYMLLPMLPIACGAFAAAWRRGEVSAKWQTFARQTLTVTAVGVAAAVVVMSVKSWTADDAEHGVLLTAMLIGGAAAVAAVAMLAKERTGPGAALVLAVVFTLSVPLGFAEDTKRTRRSGWAAGELVRELVPPEEAVHAGGVIWWKPELLFYAQRKVVGAAISGGKHPGLKSAAWGAGVEGGWWVLGGSEWKQVSRDQRGEFDQVIELQIKDWDGVLVHRGGGR
jgi:4-amino-4-deoxy-L-arabinose transferase-like glycosyltransferase